MPKTETIADIVARVQASGAPGSSLGARGNGDHHTPRQALKMFGANLADGATRWAIENGEVLNRIRATYRKVKSAGAMHSNVNPAHLNSPPLPIEKPSRDNSQTNLINISQYFSGLIRRDTVIHKILQYLLKVVSVSKLDYLRHYSKKGV